jgi:hypothetical protein
MTFVKMARSAKIVFPNQFPTFSKTDSESRKSICGASLRAMGANACPACVNAALPGLRAGALAIRAESGRLGQKLGKT